MAQKKNKKNSVEVGFWSGVGTSAAATGAISGSETYQDWKEAAEVPATKKLSSFVKKISPGDIVYEGGNNPTQLKLGNVFPKLKPQALKKIPFPRIRNIYQLAGPGYYHHADLAVPGGGLLRPGTPSVQVERTQDVIRGARARVYRAIDRREASKAIKRGIKIWGRPFGNKNTVFVKTGIKSMVMPWKIDKVKPIDTSNQICSQTVKKTYPSLFKQNYGLAQAMRRSKNFQLVARYEAARPDFKDAVYVRGVSPFLRSIKYAVPVAIAAGTIAAVYNKYKQHKYIKRWGMPRAYRYKYANRS